jgi:MFS transporter, PAT family, beta-lactamase induction signal transducer AmpG
VTHNKAVRVHLFALLYASEGAPIGFIWWALPTILRAAGVPLVDITGLTALLVLPWAFKFAWAPLVDALRSRRWGFRAWIFSAQFTMGLALLPLLWLDPVREFAAWRGLLLVHALAAATQDVAIDALAIRTVPVESRGWLNGTMQAGMLVGRSLFGGGVLLLLASFGRAWIVGALMAWIWLALLILPWVAEPSADGSVADRLREFSRHLAAAGRTASTWWGLAFALTSAAAFEATGQLAGPFLVDRGVAVGTVGLFFGVFVVAATLAGGLVGGLLADRRGHARMCAIFLAGFVFMILGLAVADRAGSSTFVLLAWLTGMYLFVGLFTAASYALFMDLTDPRLGGTQFSAFMSATNGCESWSAWSGGRLAGAFGYPVAFVTMSAVSLVTLPILAFLKRSHRRPTLATGERV